MKKVILKTIKTLILPVVLYGVFLMLSFNRFSNWNCLYTIFLQSIIPTIIAYGVAYGNICGIFDFTIGSRLIISGLVAGLCAIKFGMLGMIFGAFASSFLTAAITGGLNRVCRIPSLVLTMGITMIFEVIGKQLAGRFGFISVESKNTFLGSSPYIVFILIASAALFYVLFNNTKFSFDMRAVGSNEIVARNSGIKTELVKFKSFIYGSIFVAIAAILTISQSGSVGAQTGLGSATILFKPLISILLALVLQGICNLTIGIFISQFSLNIIFIGLIAVGMNDTFQNVVLGGFLLVVMVFFHNTERIGKIKQKLSKHRLLHEID